MRLSARTFRHRVLLVGIDFYPALGRPLYGCVNDVDSFEALLLDKVGVDPADIKKLTAPHPGTPRPTRVCEKYASARHLREAFQELADNAQEGDRILIYYAGHGCQYPMSGTTIVHEGLVPADRGQIGSYFIWDYEINAWFAEIAGKGGDLTVILDCCHAASVYRNEQQNEKPPWQERALTLRELRVENSEVPRPETGPARIVRRSMDTWDPGYAVLAACHADQRAHEVIDHKGRHSGELSAALHRVLSGYSPEKLTSLRWSDILGSLRTLECSVNGRTLKQHSWFAGRAERFVFGGPFEPRDPGFEVHKVGNVFRIQGGPWAGFSEGALAAVYGSEPARFPPLMSPEDISARIGLLRVRKGSGISCEAIAEGADFNLPAGSRARLVQAAESHQLKVVIDPYPPEAAKDLCRQANFLILAPDMPSQADICIQVLPGNGFRMIDLHDADIWKATSARPLFESSSIDPQQLLALLYHCQSYYGPLKMARALATKSPGLRIHVLDADKLDSLSPSQWQTMSLPKILPINGTVHVAQGRQVCFAVENLSPEILMYVSIVNCTSTGKVQLLGTGNEVIEPNSVHIFYANSHLSQPFVASSAPGAAPSLDRLIAIGTNQQRLELKGLATDNGFSDIYSRPARRSSTSSFPLDKHWTAASMPVLIHTSDLA